MTYSLVVASALGVLSGISLLLAVFLLRKYTRGRRASYLYWGIGIVLVFVTLLQEAALYVGVFSQLLIRSYLVLVAVLVGILSLGSAELSLRGRWKGLWFGYIGVTSVAMAVVGALTSVPSSILYDGVVWSLPPVAIVVASSLVTVPGAMMLILASAYGAWRQRRLELLYITAGTIVISVSGSLYIVSFPTTLYFAEFVGILLLFLGFVKVPGLSAPAGRPSSA